MVVALYNRQKKLVLLNWRSACKYKVFSILETLIYFQELTAECRRFNEKIHFIPRPILFLTGITVSSMLISGLRIAGESSSKKIFHLS